jgi:catechol 2,3-dioxygenase-like lactoylglutathione lyase family enzyme
MKRFHVHAHVADLAASVAFYTRLFGAPPTRHEADYAKWMLEDPRVNFAISTRGGTPGVDHLGILPVFREREPATAGAQAACCTPAGPRARGKPVGIAVAAAPSGSGCC